MAARSATGCHYACDKVTQCTSGFVQGLPNEGLIHECIRDSGRVSESIHRV